MIDVVHTAIGNVYGSIDDVGAPIDNVGAPVNKNIHLVPIDIVECRRRGIEECRYFQ
jgi:hypothetical protein